MNKQQGFTLTNCLIATTILGLLTSFALPSFSGAMSRHRAIAATNNLIGILHYARLSALERGKTVTLCPKLNNFQCGDNWSKGILVFEDNNNDGDLDIAETLLRSTRFLPSNSSLKWVSFGSNNHLRYASSGFTVSQNGSFTYCPDNGDNHYARVIIVSRSGRPRPGLDSNNNGIIETANGHDINCEP